MSASFRHITPIFLLEGRLELFAVADKGANAPYQQGQANKNHHNKQPERKRTLRICAIRPGLFFRKNGIETSSGFVHVVGAGSYTRQPLNRKHHTRFRIGTCVYVRNVVTYRTVIIDGNCSIQRAMTPRTYIFARSNLSARSNGQSQRHGYVAGIFSPTAAHKLPVQLSYIGVCLRSLGYRIVQLHNVRFVFHRKEYIDGVLGLIERVSIATRATRFTPIKLEGYAGELRERLRRRTHAYAVDLDIGTRRQVIEVPPYRRKSTAEIEHALLNHMQITVWLHRCVDGGMRHFV